jgi:prolycopene isomerase
VEAGAVLSTADLRHTCFDLIGRERLPQGLLKKFEQGAPSETMFTVYLGLSEACAESGALDRFRESHVLFFSRSGRLIQLVLLTKDDPSLAPPGKHALCISAFSPYEHWQPWAENHDAAYQACKEAEAWRLIHLAQEFIPGLSAYIEEMDAATPLTYERYTGNWKGASVGWSWDPARNPRINFKKDFPALPNFYLAGHWTFRLGGMLSAMITARYAALEVCKAASPGDRF